MVWKVSSVNDFYLLMIDWFVWKVLTIIKLVELDIEGFNEMVISITQEHSSDTLNKKVELDGVFIKGIFIFMSLLALLYYATNQD